MKTKFPKLCLVLVVLLSPIVFAQGINMILATLTGYEEVPAVSTTGKGTLLAKVSTDESSIQWVLSYSDLEAAIQQSHIHIGNSGVNGGISVFLCTNLGNGPAGVQACPPAPATISGVITASEVSPNVAATMPARVQGLDTGEMKELIKAMRAGATYVNIHTATWPGGEIRKQINLSSATPK